MGFLSKLSFESNSCVSQTCIEKVVLNKQEQLRPTVVDLRARCNTGTVQLQVRGLDTNSMRGTAGEARYQFVRAVAELRVLYLGTRTKASQGAHRFPLSPHATTE